MKEINKQKELKYSSNMIDRILYSLTEICKPLNPFIEYGYLDDYDIENILLTNDDGMFILNLKRNETIDVSINYRKEKRKEFNLYYFYPNSIENDRYKTDIWIENVLDKLIASDLVKNTCRAIDYKYESELVKIEETDLTGTLQFDIKIQLIEF